MKHLMTLENVGLAYPSSRKGHYRALTDVNLAVNAGEIVCVVGNSGAGKSTLIQLAGGLLPPTEGVVIFAGQEVTGPSPDRAMVCDANTLLPWLSCHDNVYLAVEQVFGKTEARSQLRARARRALTQVALHKVEHRVPSELSAGMRQRLGLARALAMAPKALLLDDPLASLDPPTRRHLRTLLRQQSQASGMGIVLATSDIDDALAMADRIAMLTDGPQATIGDIIDHVPNQPDPDQDIGISPFPDCREPTLAFPQNAGLQ